MKKSAIGIFLVFAMAGICSLWRLHPWTPEGSSLALGRWKFDEFEFQVWQRKTPDIFEPFADGLFVRRGSNSWVVFCFDIQDRYSPKVRLERKNSEVVVYRDGENRGRYDLTTQTFRQYEQPFNAGPV